MTHCKNSESKFYEKEQLVQQYGHDVYAQNAW